MCIYLYIFQSHETNSELCKGHFLSIYIKLHKTSVIKSNGTNWYTIKVPKSNHR